MSFEGNMITNPNPFTTSTTLLYELKEPSTVKLSIYKQLGQLVYQRYESQKQGPQQLQWDAMGQSEGIYITGCKYVMR